MSKRNVWCLMGMGLLSGSVALGVEGAKDQVKVQEPEALPPLVVMASKTGAVVGSLGQSVSILPGQGLEWHGFQTLGDALRGLPGIGFTQSGPIDSSNMRISIRGMRPYHTKFLIDGVPFHDPSTTQMGPLVGGIRLDSVDRLEIVKGSSSLQGTSAMGGVINLVTKRPTEEGLHGSVFQELGSHGRSTTALELLGKHDILDYRLNVGRMRERGISTIYRDSLGKLNLDDDHLRLLTYDGRIGLQLNENWRAEVFGLFQDRDEEYDDGHMDEWQELQPDTDDTFVRRTMFGGVLKGRDLFNGLLDTSLQAAMTRADRIYHTQDGHQGSRFTGDHRELNWNGTFHLDERNDLTLGSIFEEDQMRRYDGHVRDMNRTHRTMSYYVGYQTEPIDNLFINLNGRMVDHSEFGIDFVGDASARYTVEATGTTFKGSIGRGYRTPSLDELYNDYRMSNYEMTGNPNLDPETSYTWEVGFEQALLDKRVTFGSVYFENRVDDMITSTGTFDAGTYHATYEQLAGVTIRGFESFVDVALLERAMNLKFTHTYQWAENEESGADFIGYLPRHKVSMDLLYKCLENQALVLDLGGAFVGSRWNSNERASREKIEDYILMHLSATYSLTKNLSISARIDNLLNTRYFDDYSWGTYYNTYGRTYYVGVKYSF